LDGRLAKIKGLFIFNDDHIVYRLQPSQELIRLNQTNFIKPVVGYKNILKGGDNG